MIYISLGLIWAFIIGIGTLMLNINKIWVGIISFFALLFGTGMAYLSTPVLGLFEIGTWAFVLTPIVFVGILAMISLADRHHEPGDGKPKFLFLSAISSVVILALFSFFTTAPMIHSKAYHSLLEVIEEEEFVAEEVLFDQSQARFVDQSLSARSANEILGQVRGMGSRYKIDTMRIQNVDGELQWLAPFVHSSFFKWMDDNTSPGYVSVSINDYSDAEMFIDDKNINYGEEGFYFSSYLPRHLYANGYASTLLDDYTMEVDNNGKPYWVVSILERKVGFSGKIATGILTIDARTGDIEEHTIEDAPEWVDRIQPEGIVEELITDWGKYADGWWNGTIVGNEVIEATPGSSIVFTKDGSSSWYTGMQSNSASNKESTMGFMLVDSRTGKATFYQRTGITETVAKTAIEGRVQDLGYYASNPIPYNINGKTTFLAILKDNNGNMQGVGLVAYDDRSKVAFGETFDIALRRYISTLSSGSGSENMDSSMESISITGVVDRSYLQTVDNRLVLNFTLNNEEYQGMVFIVQADGNKHAMFTRDNDSVSFETYSLENESIQVFNFETDYFQ